MVLARLHRKTYLLTQSGCGIEIKRSLGRNTALPLTRVLEKRTRIGLETRTKHRNRTAQHSIA